MDLMIHDIDLVLHLVQAPVESVHAVGVSVVGDHEDLANARLVFKNGAVANVTASRMALKTERKLRLFARDCYVTLDFKEKSGRIVRPSPRLRSELTKGTFAEGRLNPLEVMLKKLVTTETLKVRAELEPLAEEDQEFLAAVRDRRDPLITGEHGLVAIETAESVVRSLRENLARAEGGDGSRPGS
jgi:predicted dehydrogenase